MPLTMVVGKNLAIVGPTTVALREMCEYQKPTKILIPKLPFIRLTEEIIEGMKTNYRVQASAFLALHNENRFMPCVEPSCPRTCRHGTLALHKIRKYLKSTELLVRKLPFAKLEKELHAEVAEAFYCIQASALLALQEATDPILRLASIQASTSKPLPCFHIKALLAIQEATEAYLLGVFEDCNFCALDAKHVTIMPKEIQAESRGAFLGRDVVVADSVNAVVTLPKATNSLPTDIDTLRKHERAQFQATFRYFSSSYRRSVPSFVPSPMVHNKQPEVKPDVVAGAHWTDDAGWQLSQLNWMTAKLA
eukprot:gene23042-biopygen31651